jgi:hypothetical protein
MTQKLHQMQKTLGTFTGIWCLRKQFGQAKCLTGGVNIDFDHNRCLKSLINLAAKVNDTSSEKWKVRRCSQYTMSKSEVSSERSRISDLHN